MYDQIFCACHVCLHDAHCHQTFLLEACVTSDGFSLPFLVGCHSRETDGDSITNALSSHTFLLAQYGQALSLYTQFVNESIAHAVIYFIRGNRTGLSLGN